MVGRFTHLHNQHQPEPPEHLPSLERKQEMEGAEVVTMVNCGCCGIGEECTEDYIAWVKAQFGGVWVCGLCTEAIKDEMSRGGVGLEAAMRVHAKFIEIAGMDPAVQIARSLLQLLKKMISASGAPVLASSRHP